MRNLFSTRPLFDVVGGNDSRQVVGAVWENVMIVLVVVVEKGGFVLTSKSCRGVPGMEPYDELVRVLGGVSRRRPNLSYLAGDAVRDMKDEPPEAAEPPDAVRLWFRRPGRVGIWSDDWLASEGCGLFLLALTRAAAAWDSC
jgi:hypothetical protein